MDNIDILEEKIKIIESLCTDDCINKETVIKPFKYAISNLISENKELKEENEGLKTKLDTLIEKYKELKEKNKELEEEDVKIRAKFILQLDNYILKSKVEELLKEIEKEGYFMFVVDRDKDIAIEYVQSLLGKE